MVLFCLPLLPLCFAAFSSVHFGGIKQDFGIRQVRSASSLFPATMHILLKLFFSRCMWQVVELHLICWLMWDIGIGVKLGWLPARRLSLSCTVNNISTVTVVCFCFHPVCYIQLLSALQVSSKQLHVLHKKLYEAQVLTILKKCKEPVILESVQRAQKA